MNSTLQHQAGILQDRYGLRIAARLSDGAADLPRDISERLRAARVQALARRKVVRVERTSSSTSLNGTVTLGFDEERLGWWGRVASVLPLLVLAAGLVAINVVQNEYRAAEVAEVDADLLTDDLPPSAYADPGFVQFLKTGGDSNP